MNNLPRQTLRQILNKYGTEIISDARRCENLLNDLCGSHRREINVLINAIEERIPFDLLNGIGSMPLELLLARLEKRLEEHTAMTAEAARWAVESWATALDLATAAEIEAREKRAKSSPPRSNAGTVQPNDSADNGKTPISNRTNPFQPPTRINPPPVIRQPAKMPSPLPPVFAPTNNPPAASPPLQPQTTNPPVIVKRGFGLFRGCLLVIFLLIISSIIMFLGVPFAIEKMRETQDERNSEPPRFPVR